MKTLLITTTATDLEGEIAKSCGHLVPAATDTDVQPKKKKVKELLEKAVKLFPELKKIELDTAPSPEAYKPTKTSIGLSIDAGLRRLQEMRDLSYQIRSLVAQDESFKVLQDVYEERYAQLQKEIKELSHDYGKAKKSLDALDDITKSFKRETVPKAGAKVRKPEKDELQKKQERAQRKAAGLSKAEFKINPSGGKKNPLLANTHGEEFHVDAHERSMEFVTSEGEILTNMPPHDSAVTPELDGFPLVLPHAYTGKSELVVPGDDEFIMAKAFEVVK